jgi:hypothetical protein
MRSLMKNLMALWLAVALIITPLQAMTADIAGAATDAAAPCAMSMAAEADSRSGTHDAHQVSQGLAASHCPPCSDHGCNTGGECASQGCVSFHIQPAVIVGTLLHHSRNAESRVRVEPTLIASRTDPPPLRPPV